MATVDERRADGKAARARRPRSSLADYAPALDRADPVEVLQSQEADRVAALCPLRHRRMSASPFAFYRGSAAIMAADLGAMESTGLTTQLCGDAHVANFGLFAAPDRSVVFDVNDFDETNPGPFEWDVLRLATSLALAGEELGAGKSKTQTIVEASARGYHEQMDVHAGLPNMDNWYSRIDSSFLKEWGRSEGAEAHKTMTASVAKAESRDMWSAVAKMTTVKDGVRAFINEPPLLLPLELDSAVVHRVTSTLSRYRETLPADRQELLDRYTFTDFAHKVVGVGSVGLLAIVVLLGGRDDEDILALQAKQAVRSVLEPFTSASVFPEHGQRVVVGQQLMQGASDPLLGWASTEAGRSFYIRQLRDKKYSPVITTMSPAALADYAQLCGRALARAHARSGDAVALAGYLGSGSGFTEAVTTFAFAYAQQVHRDFSEFLAGIESGRVTVGSPEEDQQLALSLNDEGAITVSAKSIPDMPPRAL